MGLTSEQLEALAKAGPVVRKCSRRDLAVAIAQVIPISILILYCTTVQTVRVAKTGVSFYVTVGKRCMCCFVDVAYPGVNLLPPVR